VCRPRLDDEDLVDQLASQGIAISTGSACAHGARKPPHVATALGLTYEQARGCVRISLSIESTAEEIDAFLSALGTALHTLESQDAPTTGAVA
jgi:cysteine desulfurase